MPEIDIDDRLVQHTVDLLAAQHASMFLRHAAATEADRRETAELFVERLIGPVLKAFAADTSEEE